MKNKEFTVFIKFELINLRSIHALQGDKIFFRLKDSFFSNLFYLNKSHLFFLFFQYLPESQEKNFIWPIY